MQLLDKNYSIFIQQLNEKLMQCTKYQILYYLSQLYLNSLQGKEELLKKGLACTFPNNLRQTYKISVGC